MKKRTIRKVWAKIDPIAHAIAGASITPASERDRLLLRELSALDDFTKGRATIQQWSDLSMVLNLCETVAKEKIGAEALPACKTAESALIEAAIRFEQTGRMGLSGPGITAMREVIEYHDAQRASISRSQYERLIKLCIARVKGGHQTTNVCEAFH